MNDKQDNSFITVAFGENAFQLLAAQSTQSGRECRNASVTLKSAICFLPAEALFQGVGGRSNHSKAL
jgi:hypothetical protein